MLAKGFIAEMADIHRPLVNSYLADLSQMAPEDLSDYDQTWKTIDLKRRREIITRLIELAADSAELDFDLIFKKCLTDPDADIRSEAIEGLWENEDPSLIPSFIDLLNTDPSEKVQASAAIMLGRFALMAELGTIGPRNGNLVGQVLLAVIDDNSKAVEVRRRALEAVAILSTQQVKETIKNAYKSRDERLMVSAIYAMGRNCDPNWMPLLLKELDNHDAEIRYEAVSACGEMGTEEIVSYLLPLANDPDLDVCLATIEALGKIGGNKAKRYLHENSTDSSEAIRDAIEQALAEIELQDDVTLSQMSLPPRGHNDKGE
ncbi:MAG: HEAT repeat domain-containing protein [Chloroflexi bacterium]|nr:HEAT repeat domain-containing protein [Chloroflexota bacterium]